MNPEITRHKTELEDLCRRFGVRRLELFGSAAVGKYRPGESDLDFLVEFEELPRGTYSYTYLLLI